MKIKISLALALTLQLAVVWRALASAADHRLDVYWIDSEGGGSTLIVTPTDESMLIDTGNPGERDAGRIFNVAANVAGLKKIDHLLVTHYHIDHFGGAARLATLIPIGSVYDNGMFKEGWERPSQEYLDLKCDQRIIIPVWQRGSISSIRPPTRPRMPIARILAANRQIQATTPIVSCCCSPSARFGFMTAAI